MNSLVSVIIPTYNREKLVGRAIQSVIEQTYASLEIIVVDDCSSDKTSEQLKKFNDARLRFIQHSKNMGVSAACNTGIREAKGEFVFILNDDDFLIASAIENLIKQFQQSSVQNLGAVYGWSLWINERGKPIKITHSMGRGNLFDPILEGHVFTNLLLKREVFTKIGVYNEELKSNEDLEFYLRLAKRYQFDFIPEIVAVISSHPHSHLSAFSKKHMDTYVRIQNKYGLRKSISKGFARSVLPPRLYRLLARLKAKVAVELFLLKNPRLKTIFKKSNMTIGWIEISKKKYGGVLYNEEARAALSKDFDVELVVKEAKLFKNIRYLKIPESFARLLFLKGEKDFWVRDFYSTLTMPFDRTRGKNIVVIHHDDFSGFPLLPRAVLIFLQKTLFYWALKRADVIVTVSEYWKQHFLRKGYKNVHIIYNGFDLAQFDASRKQVEEFKKKYNLEGKPIVYLGNCQKAKGVVEAYEQLKELDVHLVTSGRKQANIPVKNLELDFHDYLRLLKASSVVLTMSKFKEGWCRTAHEAMLLETPVIGSGKGGMRELLQGGGQLICEDFSQLCPLVERVLQDAKFRDKLGTQGRRFSEGFSIERFSKEWLSFIKSI